MTFLDLQKYVYRRTGHADTPTSAISTRIKQFLNERMRELLTMEGIERLRQQTLTFASDTSNAEYALPQVVNKILKIHERTNDYPLEYMPLHEYRLWNPDPPNMEGTPYWYCELGDSPVALQPNDATHEVFLKHLGSGDTDLTATVEMVLGNNYHRVVTTAALSGTAAVSADTSAKTVSHVTRFHISDTSTSDVAIFQAGDTTSDFRELGRIPKGKTRVHYTRIALIPKPSAAVTYHVDAEVEVTDLVNNTDEPPLPRDFHWVLGQGALIDEYTKQEKTTEAKRAELQWFGGIKALKNWVANNADYIPVVGRSRTRGISRLGPFYPADRFPFS